MYIFIYIYIYIYIYIIYTYIHIFFFILLLAPMQTYIWQKKNWALFTDLLKVKSNMFLPDNCHTQKRTYSLNTHP